MLKVAFQMDGDVVVGSDTTVKLVEEGKRRGHEVFFYQPRELTLWCGDLVASRAYSVDIGTHELHRYNETRLVLSDLDMLFIRQNPPVDMRYITSTYLLEMLANVKVINNPKAVRDLPEKLLPLMFKEFIPPTLVTENVKEVRDFYEEYSDIVIKPMYSFGGEGVIRVCGETDAGVIASVLIDLYKAPVIAQKFITDIKDDRRIVLLAGKPIGAIRRKIMSQREIRTNLKVGAVPEAVALSDRDSEICLAVGAKIAAAGIEIAGIDILGGYLLEVNVTSPCGILEINQVYGTKLEIDCWNHFESLLQ